MNECNNQSFEAYQQLEPRTKIRTYLDYNPTHEFWVHEKVVPQPNNTFIKSTYLDAKEMLSAKEIESIESRKDTDANWWRVYGLGEIGSVEGLVFPEFKIIDLPEHAKLIGYGLDFGYTNHETALVALYKADNELIYDELIYDKGLTNRDIFERVMTKIDFTVPCYADSAEPKSIDELLLMGWQGIRPVSKGADSIRNGIQYMKQSKINVTKSSTNLIKEFRNYRWATDKNGTTIYPERPVDFMNHGLDSSRYVTWMQSMMQMNKVNYLGVV